MLANSFHFSPNCPQLKPASRPPSTLAELAREVGTSRSAREELFTRYLTEPPSAYLMRWRLQLAARALAATSRGVAEIAADVGYESEAAFNRAFGLPPRAVQAGTKNSRQSIR
jgi:transcriptional regulator GlxA family with amidase domain